MDRQIAFVLAGACVALGVGGYLMSGSFKEYDLNASAVREEARVERLEGGVEKKGFFASLIETYGSKLEVARNQYLGEHLPATPDGWKIAKTHHDEFVDFTTDYKLETTLLDKSSMRRFTGFGGATSMRHTDVAFRNGDKVIFLRLGFANFKRDEPVRDDSSQLFIGIAEEQAEFDMHGLRFVSRMYENSEVVNIYARVGHFTSLGVLSNASLAEVNQLLSTMDMFEFGSLSGDPTRNGGLLAVVKPIGGNGASTMVTANLEGDGAETVEPVRKPSPAGNMISGLAGKEGDSADVEEVEQERKPKKAKNLLSSLLGSGSEKIAKRKKKKDRAAKGGAFQRVGNFTSRCKSGHGAKVCRVE